MSDYQREEIDAQQIMKQFQSGLPASRPNWTDGQEPYYAFRRHKCLISASLNPLEHRVTMLLKGPHYAEICK